MELNFDLIEMMSHVLDWLDVIGTTGHQVIDIALFLLVSGVSSVVLVTYMFHEGRH